MSISKELIFEEIRNRGFEVEEKEVIKNGLKREAFCIKAEEHNATPTFYVEQILQRAYEADFSVFDIADEIMDTYKKHITDFDIDCLRDKEYVLSHLAIAIQKEGTEELIKRKTAFEGIEAYLYVKVIVNGAGGSIKLNPSIMKLADITLEEAWSRAENNLHENTLIEPLSNIFGSMFGAPDNSMRELDNYMFVISNKEKVKGGSSVLDMKSIKSLGEKLKRTKFVYLPSSIHEGILIPADDNTDLDLYTNMVKKVNQTTVSEEDRLVDRAYLLTI